MNALTEHRPRHATSGFGGPFDLEDEAAYRRWRAWKLGNLLQGPVPVVPVRDGRRLTAAERRALLQCIGRCNLAIYEIQEGDFADKEVVRALGAQLGLHRLDNNLCADGDGITSLRVVPEGRHGEYIPYSNRRLSWHTDGYYNPPERSIKAIVMHCVRSAEQGGGNAFLDHELAYILLRDRDPDYVAALMRPDAMLVPANVDNGVELRPAQGGPVFWVDAESGNLHMRYTARGRNIVWRQDAATQGAVGLLHQALEDSPYVLQHRLRPGQGVVCNNVLHRREGFVDGPDLAQRRLLYRARYYDRIARTDLRELWEGGAACCG